MVSLKVKKGQDLGVIQLKNGLADAMDRRFSTMESVPGYTVATFCDPRLALVFQYLNFHVSYPQT